MRCTVTIYTSDHGFGHAVRACFLAEALIAHGAFCHIVCNRPAWLFDRLPTGTFALHPRQIDTGLVQNDWLTIDIAETLARHRQRTANPESLIDREVAFLREVGTDLVVAEIAPIALEIAYRADLPSGLATNFDWHWLYRALAQTEPALIPLADQAYAWYQRAIRVLRLPLNVGVEETFVSFTDIPLLVGALRRDRAAVHRALDLPLDAKTLMWNFGGHQGADLDFDAILNALPDWHLLTYAEYPTANPRYRRIPLTFNTTDLFSILDALVGKLGYCSCAEAYAFQIPFLFFSRAGYPEDDALATHCQHAMNAAPLTLANLQSGTWLDTFQAVISKPPQSKPRTNGADQAASIFMDMLS